MNKKISIFVALIFTISIASLAIYEEFFAFESRGFSTNDEKKLLSGFKSFSDFVETGGFESADEARDMLAKGFLAFDEFVKTGGFESVDEARDLMSKGFLAFDEFVKTGGFESVDEARDMLAKGFLTFDEFVKGRGFESADEARDLMSKGYENWHSFYRASKAPSYGVARSLIALGIYNFDAHVEQGKFASKVEATKLAKLGYLSFSDYVTAGNFNTEEAARKAAENNIFTEDDRINFIKKNTLTKYSGVNFKKEPLDESNLDSRALASLVMTKDEKEKYWKHPARMRTYVPSWKFEDCLTQSKKVCYGKAAHVYIEKFRTNFIGSLDGENWRLMGADCNTKASAHMLLNFAPSKKITSKGDFGGKCVEAIVFIEPSSKQRAYWRAEPLTASALLVAVLEEENETQAVERRALMELEEKKRVIEKNKTNGRWLRNNISSDAKKECEVAVREFIYENVKKEYEWVSRTIFPSFHLKPKPYMATLLGDGALYVSEPDKLIGDNSRNFAYYCEIDARTGKLHRVGFQKNVKW
jgi:hypothetical protein